MVYKVETMIFKMSEYQYYHMGCEIPFRFDEIRCINFDENSPKIGPKIGSMPMNTLNLILVLNIVYAQTHFLLLLVSVEWV